MLVKVILLLVGLSCCNSSNAQICNASFYYDTTHCPNIYFTSNSTASGNIICTMFDYGNQGNVDFCPIAHNKFNTNGAFEVCVSIMTDDNCMDTWCDSVYINCNIPETCQSDFSIDYSSCPDVAFTDLSTDSVSAINNHIWTMNYGDTITTQNAQYNFPQNGNYTVCLYVETANGCESTHCEPINIGCIPCPPPVADFSWSTNELQVVFSQNSQCDSNTVSWEWDFGDGTNSTLEHPDHFYGQDGTYTVCLIITDACGADTICQDVTVLASGMATQNPGDFVNWSLNNGQLHMRTIHAADEFKSIRIFDLSGKEIFSVPDMHHEEVFFDVSRISGAFFVQTEMAGGEAFVIRAINPR